MRPSVVVLDYGSGNLRSAQRALERAGARVCVTADSAAAVRCAGLVVPGVGAFAACMRGLTAVGGHDTVLERVSAQRPLLGICVGMQILFDGGEEHGELTSGLGVLPGKVARLPAPVLPHIGWNTVTVAPGSRLLPPEPGARFYFVHSYAALAAPPGALATWSMYGAPFVAAVEVGSVAATQFHPEKSAETGIALLRRWLATL